MNNNSKVPTPALVLAGCILLGGALVLLYGERLLTNRFTVGRFTYLLPSGSSGVTNEGAIVTGLKTALARNGIDPAIWVVPAASRWEATSAASLTNGRPASVLIVLSNRFDRRELYVRVEPARPPGALRYHIYRPK